MEQEGIDKDEEQESRAVEEGGDRIQRNTLGEDTPNL